MCRTEGPVGCLLSPTYKHYLVYLYIDLTLLFYAARINPNPVQSPVCSQVTNVVRIGPRFLSILCKGFHMWNSLPRGISMLVG